MEIWIQRCEIPCPNRLRSATTRHVVEPNGAGRIRILRKCQSGGRSSPLEPKNRASHRSRLFRWETAHSEIQWVRKRGCRATLDSIFERISEFLGAAGLV